ncbi:cell division protein FtsQ/DivIB [Rhodobacteraceae bacterium NNCM2]|nr:cell division protein FtsQ/DivIB [Coraliihabitans acroporae]
MREVTATDRTTARQAKPTGPGLSKTHYRWERGWAVRARKIAFVWFPVFLMLLLAGWIAVDSSLQASIRTRVSAVVEAAMRDPNLAVHRLEIEGGSARLQDELRDQFAPLVGLPSIRLSVADVRRQIEALGAVRSASVALSPKGVLKVSVAERYPAALWRSPAGNLYVVDRKGVKIMQAYSRAEHPDLVVILGAGALRNVPEALSIVRAAPVLRDRLRAMVRVGERRWNMVLDKDLTIMLPETEAPEAIARVMALHLGEEELLARDLKAVDMRIADRPVLRMHPRAAETWREELSTEAEAGEET